MSRKREDLIKQIRQQEAEISDLRARLNGVSISNSALSPQENTSSPQEAPNQVEENNQPMPEDLQLWIQEAKVTAHSKGAVQDLEPTAVNAGDASDGEDSGDEDRVEGLSDDVVENGSSALSPSAITDGGHSSTTKSPVVGGILHPIGLIASGAVHMGANADEEQNTGNDQQGVGIAHPGYFRPGKQPKTLIYAATPQLVFLISRNEHRPCKKVGRSRTPASPQILFPRFSNCQRS